MSNGLRDNSWHSVALARVRRALGKTWRLIPGDRRGASAILFGLSLPMLIGFVGLSVESSLWYLKKRELQEAADSAAMAGALEKSIDDAADFDAAAIFAAAQSGVQNLDPDNVNSPPLSGAFDEDLKAVEAIVVEPYNTHFVAIFGIETITIATRAVATSDGGTAQHACILACAQDAETGDPEICANNTPGIQIQGSTNIVLDECAMHSNDSCGCSYDFNGNPDLTLSCMTYSGGVGADPICGSSNDLILTGPDTCSAPHYGLPVHAPCERLTPAEARAACLAMPQAVNAGFEDPNFPGDPNYRLFQPGWYVDPTPNPNTGGIELLGNPGQTNTLAPGLYCIEDDIRINGASLIAEDVTFVMMDEGGTFDFNGNGEFRLISPNAADIDAMNNGIGTPFAAVSQAAIPQWEGVALYLTSTQSLGEVNSCDNNINGGSTLILAGEILAPETCIVFTGNNTSSGSSDDPCFRITAGNIALSGNLTMGSTDCQMPGGGETSYSTMVGIVE